MQIDWNTIILAIIALGGTYIGYITQKTHTAVNSERTKTTEEIARLNVIIQELGEQFATYKGKSTIRKRSHKKEVPHG